MDIGALLIGLAILVATLPFVFRPFQPARGKRRLPVTDPAGASEQSPAGRREAVLVAIRDLDFDHQLGKVTEADYTGLRAELVEEAAQILQSEEKTKREADERVEALIQARRENHKAAIQCERCGRALNPEDRFCSGCGSLVHPDVCPGCHKKVQTGDAFCPACGTPLRTPKGKAERVPSAS